MGPMSRNQKPADPQPVLRLSGFLVLGLLVGLFCMHGVGSAPAAAQTAGHTRTAEARHAAAVMDAPGACGHDGHGQHGRHGPAGHTDQTCASGAVAGPPVFPALVPTAIGPAKYAGGSINAAGSGPDGGRAPPSLSELQLLRI
ncbi:DUF6153 family protein [Streptomyces sp. NPDC052236]|uniref:DUF6153 family protein n=1 Tax=Streptomyces sp. NPDC052236 TaxID=3365686 RepID=UPI0037CE08D5